MTEKQPEEMSKEELLAAYKEKDILLTASNAENAQVMAENAELKRQIPAIEPNMPQCFDHQDVTNVDSVRIFLSNAKKKRIPADIAMETGLTEGVVKKCLGVLLAKKEISGDATGYELTPS